MKQKIPILVSVSVLLVLVWSLLGINYWLHLSLHQQFFDRIQMQIDERGLQIQLFLDELSRELHQLAIDTEIVQHLHNQQATMPSGGDNPPGEIQLTLPEEQFPPLNWSRQTSPYRNYHTLSLLSSKGELLAGDGLSALQVDRVLQISNPEMEAMLFDNDVMIARVFFAERLLGYLVATVSYDQLYHYHTDVAKDGCLIFNDDHLIFPLADTVSQSSGSLSLFREFTKNNYLHFEDDERISLAVSHIGDYQSPAIFYTDIKNTPLTLVHIEDMAEHFSNRKPGIMLAILLVVSVSIVFFALLMVRSNGRNSALSETFDQQINKQKQLDRALAQRDFVIRETEIGTWSWNVPTGEIEVNETWSEMLGFSMPEIDKHISFWQERLHPDDKERVLAAVNDLLEGRTTHYRTEHRVRHRDGSWLWVRVIGAVYQHNRQGDPLVIIGIHININEIRTLCDELDQSRNDLLQIVDRFLDSMIVVDSQLKITRINDATASLLESSTAELIGRYVGEIFVEPDLLIDTYFGFPNHPAHQDKQEWRNIELTLCSAGGKRHPVSINISRLNDGSGRPTGVVAGAKDITSLKQALDKSKKQQKFISEILNILPGGVLVLGSGFDLRQRNRTFERLIEEWSTTYGMDSHDLRHRVLAEISSRMDESGNQVSGNNVVYIPFAEAGLYIEIYISQATSNRHVGRIVFLLDVTSREMLEQEKRLHSTVIRQISDGIVVTDLRGVIQYSNKAVQDISGYSLSELVGQRMSLFKSGYHDADFYASLWDQLLAGNTWQGEIKNISKDGKIFDISNSITPVRNADGEITNYVSVWRDRTEELGLRQQLVKSQKFQAVGTLAAGIAHEINTPIQYVQHNVGFIKDSFEQLIGILEKVNLMVDQCCISNDQGVCGEMTELFSKIDLEFLLKEVPESIVDSQKGISQITKIVTAMKEFCHPGKGDEKESCDINKIIKNAVTVSQNEWKYAATVDLELDPDLQCVLCYPDALQQVLLNLIINSAQSISELGGRDSEPLGRIDITTARIDGSLRILVRDNGPGIPTEHQHQIFEPFFTTKEIGKGTGQGLAIAYDVIVNKHGGRIDYVASAGSGATFEIQLPMN